MRRFFFLLTIFAAGAVPASARDYICLGDSITYGGGGANDDAYLGHLAGILRAAGELDVNMHNRGVGGENTDGGSDRLDSVLSGFPAGSMVLIMEGTNDIFRWNLGLMSPADSRDNLSEMLDTVADHGMSAVLATVVPRVSDATDRDNSLTRELNDIIHDVASGRVTVVETYDHVEPYASKFIYRDSLHPDDIGYPLVAEAFGQALLGGATPDITGPLPVHAAPNPGDTGVPLEAAVEFTVKDLGSGIDTVGAVVSIDGAVVTPGLSSPAGAEITFTHVFAAPLRFAQTVTVTLQVADTDIPPNRTSYSYSFRALDGNGTGGDIDGSGRIDGHDVAILAAAFGSSKGEGRYEFVADIDGNGVVDGVDLSIVGGGFGGRP